VGAAAYRRTSSAESLQDLSQEIRSLTLRATQWKSGCSGMRSHHVHLMPGACRLVAGAEELKWPPAPCSRRSMCTSTNAHMVDSSVSLVSIVLGVQAQRYTSYTRAVYTTTHLYRMGMRSLCGSLTLLGQRSISTQVLRICTIKRLSPEQQAAS